MSIPRVSLVDELAIADVAFDDLHGPVGDRPGEVVAATAHEIVKDDDFVGSRADDEVRQVGADGAGATSDEDALTAHVGTHVHDD
jgi:hypothetical protein